MGFVSIYNVDATVDVQTGDTVYQNGDNIASLGDTGYCKGGGIAIECGRFGFDHVAFGINHANGHSTTF